MNPPQWTLVLGLVLGEDQRKVVFRAFSWPWGQTVTRWAISHSDFRGDTWRIGPRTSQIVKTTPERENITNLKIA